MIPILWRKKMRLSKSNLRSHSQWAVETEFKLKSQEPKIPVGPACLSSQTTSHQNGVLCYVPPERIPSLCSCTCLNQNLILRGIKSHPLFLKFFSNQSHIFRFLFLEIIFLIFTFYIKFVSLSEHHFLQHLLPFWWPCQLCQNSGFFLSRGWNRSHKIYPQVAATKVLWSWVFLMSFLLTMSSVHT